MKAERWALAGLTVILSAAMAQEPGLNLPAALGAAAWLAALWAAAWGLNRWGEHDRWLLPLAGILNSLGLLLAFRLEPSAFPRDVGLSVLGLGVLLGAAFLIKRRPRLVGAYRPMALAALGILLFTAVAGRQVHGARSWLFLGPLSVEPSQLALVLLTVAAGMAVRRPWEWSAAVVAAAGLAATHNLGAVLALALVLGGVAYLAGWGYRPLVVGAVTFVLLSLIFYLVFPVVHARLALWLAPTREPRTEGYQMMQAFHSFARGGWWGRGLAGATPGRIPAAGTDFVYAAWAQIAGTVGVWAILAGYLVFLARGLAASANRFPQAALAARGLAILIACQAFLVAGGDTGLLPLTGVAMPFISRGGSTLLGNYLAVGMLLGLGPAGALGGRERRVLGVAGAVAAVLALVSVGRGMAA